MMHLCYNEIILLLKFQIWYFSSAGRNALFTLFANF
jgi:hypothetical protein